jgi:D-alanyl-D-alanine carboxypeptidase
MAGGWGAALVAALLLSAILAAPLASPEPAVLAGAVSQTPQATPPSSPILPIPGDAQPAFPHWPSEHAGTARPIELGEVQGRTAADLRRALNRARADLGLYSLALGVAIDGRVGWSGASGVALDGVTKLDGDSPFAIASITKTFTATLVLEAAERGKIGLDDPVSDYLPRVKAVRGVTVRQLLQHTSGIADLLPPMREPMTKDPDRTWTGPEVIDQLGGRWWSPGAAYGYSNSNYVLLGMLVERIYGHAFNDVLARHILRPLDLDETGVLLARDAPPLMPPSWASAFGPSGNMYASVSDLVEWAMALYGGRVLSPETLADMTTFNSDDYGLGTEAIHLGSRTGIGHSGLLRGFTSVLVHLPDENVTIALVGTWQGFDPGGALLHSRNGKPSILDVILVAAGYPREPASSPAPTPAPPGG